MFNLVEASFISNIEIEEAIPTHQIPDINYNSDNKYLYATSEGNDFIFVIDTLSNEVIKKITGVGEYPSDIAYNPDNKFIYVTNRTGNSVSVINSSSNEVIKNITGVGNGSKGIAYNPENHLIYVTNVADDSLYNKLHY